MKKKFTITIIFIFIAVVIYLSCYYQEKNDCYLSITQSGQTENSTSVVISANQQSDDEIYDILTNTLKEFNSNLYCFGIENGKGKDIYTKYIYANNLEKFNTLSLKKGRFFDESEIESDKFISSLETNDVNQIGVMNIFEKDIDFQIKTLKTYVEKNSKAFQKTFILELEDMNDLPIIQKELKKYDVILTVNTEATGGLDSIPYIMVVAFLSVFVLVLIVLFDLIKSYKQIGVEKMLGYDTFAVWMVRIPKLIGWEIILFAGISFVLSLFFFYAINVLIYGFLRKLFVYYFLICLFTLGACSLPFLYVENIPVVSVIKNRKPLKSLMWFNTLIKGIISVIMLIVLFVAFKQAGTIITQKNDRFHNWEKLKDYVVIYEVCHTSDSLDITSDESIAKCEKIYSEFNQKGGILANFNFYSPLYEKEFNESKFPDYREIEVNPNYLKTFPIKDEEGKTIWISESEKDYIVLVSAKYKNREEEIRSYFEIMKNGYSGESGEKMKKQKIKIIWMEDKQKLFSCKLDVGTEDYNMVEVPLVRVITASNMVREDCSSVLATTGDPFKIKVDDVNNPEPEIDKVLSKHFDLTEITFPLVSVYKSIEDQVRMSRDLLGIMIALFIVLLVASFSIIIQNVIIFIERYRKILAVKKFMGYRLFDKYKIYFINLLACYLLPEIVLLLVKKDLKIVILGTFLFAVDFIFSIIYISIQDRKNIIQIAKSS